MLALTRPKEIEILEVETSDAPGCKYRRRLCQEGTAGVPAGGEYSLVTYFDKAFMIC